MKHTLELLVEDIYDLIDSGYEPDSDNLEFLGESIKQAVIKQLHPANRQTKTRLRMSNLGKKDKQLWYEINSTEKETLEPTTRLKFLFGDIIESLLLYLIKETKNYELTDEQARVEVDGIVGHMDCKINGVMVDIKSTSSFSFKKFKEGTLAMDDPFGYIGQISGYAYASDCKEAGFLAMDKQLGKLAYLPVTDMIDVPKRIADIKKIIASPTPPERCYEPIEDGKSGNKKLAIGCSYCAFKKDCWSDSNNGKGLRTFIYSTGPRYLTDVGREPNVYEVP